MENESGNTNHGAASLKPSDSVATPDHNSGSETGISKEDEIFGRAIKEVDEVDDGGRNIAYANRQFADDVGRALSSVSGVATNADPRDAAYKEIQQVHEEFGYGIRSTLSQLSDTLEKSIVDPHARSEIETLIKRALATKDPLEAQKIAESAVDSFGKMIKGVSGKTDDLEEQRRRVAGGSNQNEEESHYIHRNLQSELSQNYLSASVNLTQIISESDAKVNGVEEQERTGNVDRFTRFTNALSGLLTPTEQPPVDISSV